MLRKFLLPALLAGTLAGCATNYYYRDAGYGGGYYYGEPTVDYNYYGGYGWYGYGWWGWPYYSAWYGPRYGFPYGYGYWGDPYWPYYDGYYGRPPHHPGPGRDDDELVEKQGNDIRHLRINDRTGELYTPVMPRRDGVLVEKRGGQPPILRLPGRGLDPGAGPQPAGTLTQRQGAEPRVLRPPPARTSEPRTTTTRSFEPRPAPSHPPMRAPSAPSHRSPNTVRRNEE